MPRPRTADPLLRGRSTREALRGTSAALIVRHDLLATAAAILAAFYLRFEAPGLVERRDVLVILLPCIVIYAGFVYSFFSSRRARSGVSSLPDLWNIFRSASVLRRSRCWCSITSLLSPKLCGTLRSARSPSCCTGSCRCSFSAARIAYRYFRYARTRQQARISESLPTLILGRAADVEVLLRAIESGAVKKIWPIGILSPSGADQGQSIRGISVLGTFDELERVVAGLGARDRSVARLVLTPSALAPEAKPETIMMKARRLGLATSRLPSLEEGEALRLAPVNVEDLLLRPSVRIDYRRLETFVSGKAIVVTGGGGSIGAEICDRIVTFGASRLLVIENSEPALHAILETLATKEAPAVIEGRLADIRDRDRIFHLFADFKPDIVFHAAALKHVPLLEQDWGEGVKTNVFGSVNVADAPPLPARPAW